MDPQLQKTKRSPWKWIAIIAGCLVLGYVLLIVVDTVRVHKQLLSGTYNFNAYGQETSGKGGSNVDLVHIYDVATSDDPAIGPVGAPIEIVEFGDFECPYCERSFPIIRSLVSQYGDSVRYQFRDFPLTDIHPSAEIAARAGYCAEEQKRFWPMHDKLFQNQDRLAESDIIRYATQIGLTVDDFKTCLSSDDSLREIAEDYQDGVAAGVLGTPTWYINGIRIAGVIPEDVFRQIIEDIISK